MENVEVTMLKKRIEKLEAKLDRIEDIRQIPQSASLGSLIDIVNKITDNMKRKR